MKPAAVINQGEQFVTLRVTTDRPAEIQEALLTRDVQHVYKGDQNQAWDAVLANHCLARALGDSGTDLTFFIQDERLGTGDARLTRYWRAADRRYVLTEDYYRGRAGAVWVHQDASYGLFFTEAVSPEQFAAASIPLHRTAEVWENHAAEALRDAEWVRALAALGVTLPGLPDELSADAATRLGPVVNPETLHRFGAEHPVGALYYGLTKTDGLYGLAPVEDANVTLSSIRADDPELRRAGAWLLTHIAARGAMRLAGSAAQRRGMKARARKVAEWAEGFLRENPDASITDVQAALGRWLTAEIFPADRLELDRTSHFAHLEPADLPRLRTPEETLYFFLDLALRHPAEFTEAYNEALNRVGFGLQRIKWEPRSGRYTPPFFVELAPGGPGTPVYRYGLQLEGLRATTLLLTNASAGDITLETDRRITSVHDLARALFEHLPHTGGVVLVGKAATFAAELQRSPRGLGLPRQGSKYAPMVDHLVSGLRARGVLSQPTGLLIRIGLNAMDRLEAMGDLPLRLPRFLHGALGERATCGDVARRWRAVASDARELLHLLAQCLPGQHVHLVKALCLNARGGDWEAALNADPRLAHLAAQLSADPDGARRLRELGRELPLEVVACLERLTAQREALLRERRERLEAAAAQAKREGKRRVQPEVADLDARRERVECQQQLLLAAYVRRLWQRAESLPYLNDRPYTLALYLLFGRDIFPAICREVEFDVEWVSPFLSNSEHSVAHEIRA